MDDFVGCCNFVRFLSSFFMVSDRFSRFSSCFSRNVANIRCYVEGESHYTTLETRYFAEIWVRFCRNIDTKFGRGRRETLARTKSAHTDVASLWCSRHMMLKGTHSTCRSGRSIMLWWTPASTASLAWTRLARTHRCPMPPCSLTFRASDPDVRQVVRRVGLVAADPEVDLSRCTCHVTVSAGVVARG